MVPRAGIRFEPIAAAGLRGMALQQSVRNLARTAYGTWQAGYLISRFRPDVTFVTGGYVSAPVVLASWLKRVPVVIYLPDIVPGLAIKRLARLATHLAVSFEESRRYLPPQKTIATGYPVRAGLQAVDRAEAHRRLNLDPALKTVLVFGGSRGARRINQAVAAVAGELLELAQLIHISGRLDIAAMKQQRLTLPAVLRERYHLFAYLHEEMIDALAAADLVVSRAGAATLGEFPAAGVPAVLVPYPHAGAHQAENAAVLAEAGGAVIVPDAELTAERLLSTVHTLLTDETRLATMRANMSRLARPDAARQIANLLWEAARPRKDVNCKCLD